MIKNRRLAKSVADAGFSEFFRQLEYKGKWNYKLVRKVDRFYASSQICSECGHQSERTKDLSVRLYQCGVCGLEIDRDFNAAINILKEGLRTAI
jgi:putative transposase